VLLVGGLTIYGLVAAIVWRLAPAYIDVQYLGPVGLAAMFWPAFMACCYADRVELRAKYALKIRDPYLEAAWREVEEIAPSDSGNEGGVSGGALGGPQT
jgi:hypothetical protein